MPLTVHNITSYIFMVTSSMPCPKHDPQRDMCLLYILICIKYFLLKFRTSNHRLPIEEGRFNQIARADRKCLACDSNDIGDEYHYICLCPKFDEIRKKTLKKDLIRNPSVKKFCDLFSMRNKTKLRKISNNDKSDSK